MNEALWRRVECALDDRRDPRDGHPADPELAAELRADARARLEVERLMRRLEVLAADVPVATGSHAGLRLAVAAALLLAFAVAFVRSGSWRAHGSDGAVALRAADVRLVVERTTPPRATGGRVVLERRRVLEWTLEGETP